MKFHSLIDTVYGTMLLTSDGNFLTGSYFVGQKHFPNINAKWIKEDNLDIFTDTKLQLEEYFGGTKTRFDINYKFEGTSLQHKVWNKLSEIKFGEKVSYKNIASSIGSPKAIRVVASAIARNPLTIIIPCHRVIGSDGTLKGYAAGIDLKKTLLIKEEAYISACS